MQFKQVLISVSDKTGIIECAQGLVKGGAQIVSTGGTAEALIKNAVPVKTVEKQTGFAEVMDGRVKTLHPHIFMPLLARRDNASDQAELKKQGLTHFDLVICNLYPFEKNEIDVGGASILRAAAKNFEKIAVLFDPQDYPLLKREKPFLLEEKKELASKVFSYLSFYDFHNAKNLKVKNSSQTKYKTLGGKLFQELRYGENPGQKASWFSRSKKGLHQAQLIQGKKLSFNNILDLNAAIGLMRALKGLGPALALGVKHQNPCGAAGGGSPALALRRCFLADPVSIFGGVIALNKEVDEESAEFLSRHFIECLIAPSYSKKALKNLERKKRLRLLAWEEMLTPPSTRGESLHSLEGGFLSQEEPRLFFSLDQCLVHGDEPPDSLKKDLEMAWKVSAFLKSNAVCLVSGGQTVGMGMGQVDRISAVEQAFLRMRQHHKNLKSPVVMASDGFFPFEDAVEKAAGEGLRWIIQPGGSIRDDSILKKAGELKISMILTGQRHFKH